MTDTPPASARRPRRDALENRAGILAAARVALAHDPRASIDAIAREAGVSPGTLYNHIPDLRELRAGVVPRQLEALTQ